MAKVTVEELLCGVLLGDGCLERRGNARLRIQRKKEHLEYNEWLRSLLGEYFDFGPDDTCSVYDGRTSKTYDSVVIKTRADKFLTEMHTIWYEGRKRVVPIDFVVEHFTSLSLAIWYLDDGTLTYVKGNYRIVLATNRYRKEEVEFLAWLLQDRYGIKAHVTAWGNGSYVLRMFQEESKKLLDVINMELPTIACMQYKLELNKKGDVLS